MKIYDFNQIFKDNRFCIKEMIELLEFVLSESIPSHYFSMFYFLFIIFRNISKYKHKNYCKYNNFISAQGWNQKKVV